MKKILSVLMAALILSTVAFGAEYSITDRDFNRVADEILIQYSGYSEEYMTIFVYDVTGIVDASEETPWDNIDDTPIIGLDQAQGSGEFIVKIKPDYTGDVVIVLGGEMGSSTKILLHIENGIPEAIVDAEYDAGGESVTVGDDKVISIQQGKKLLNASVSTTGTGKVEYVNENSETVTLTGDIMFDAQGEIDAISGKTVEIKSVNENSTYNIGYINKTVVTSDKTKYIVTMTASDGKSATKTFDLNSLEGEIRVRAGIQNVPSDITVTQTITIE